LPDILKRLRALERSVAADRARDEADDR
jgi:hypothetical protein